jgi:CDGSH-type Zn-finger protein/uncharacterized Fe-S cluster protein YjdI
MSGKIHKYQGKDVSVKWDGRLCIHVGECGRAKGDLFVGGRDPWCQPDLAQNEEVADVISRCPSGALTMVDAADKVIEEPVPAENTGIVVNDGPVYLSGELEIEGAPEDMPGVKRRVALCRCGASKNKPFCDNSHRDVDFREAGAIGDTGVPEMEAGGPLKITPFTDGPVMVEGNLVLKAGSGRNAWQGRKVFLCRCGASKNKPFCDGTHKDIDFKAE